MIRFSKYAIVGVVGPVVYMLGRGSNSRTSNSPMMGKRCHGSPR